MPFSQIYLALLLQCFIMQSRKIAYKEGINMKKQLISVFCAVAMTCSIHAATLTNFTDVHPED